MVARRFEWDPEKERSNIRKHGLDFAEAIRVFADPLFVSTPDFAEHGEVRWKTVGRSTGLTIVVVVHMLWETDDEGCFIEIVRIISARQVTRRERRRYENEDG